MEKSAFLVEKTALYAEKSPHFSTQKVFYVEKRAFYVAMTTLHVEKWAHFST